MNDVAIRTRGLRKVFGARAKIGRVRRARRDVIAVEGIDLEEVDPGVDLEELVRRIYVGHPLR